MHRYLINALVPLAIAAVCLTLFWIDSSVLFFNLPGLLMVVIGTLVATMLGQSFKTVLTLFWQIPQKLSRQPVLDESGMEVFLRLSEFHRQGNVWLSEQAIDSIQHPFLRYGVQLVIDRTPHEDLSRLLHWKIGAQREKDQAEIQILRTMMAFAPAFGMLGTLFGLIHMLYGLNNDALQQIGEATGFALLTTVYGLMLANLVLKPLCMRLEQRSKQRLAWLYVQSEAVMMMQEKRHPLLIKEYLQAFLGHPKQIRQEERSHLSLARS